jgi:soluble lytic murein transglycosylase-like protein
LNILRFFFSISVLILSAAATVGAQIPAQANQYRTRLTREARAAGGLTAPIATFAAQIHQESRWSPSARSGVGAMGLAQFMPGTAAWIAQIYPKDLGPAAPLDADWAIRALVRYDYNLYGQLGSFQSVPPATDRWAAALASYNGGLGWTLKDQKAVVCAKTQWWSCVAGYHDARSVSNWTQNRDYPNLILIRYEPMYQKAGW